MRRRHSIFQILKASAVLASRKFQTPSTMTMTMTKTTQDVDSSSSTGSQVMNSLPQYGFGSEHTFDNLIQDNPFLFRVYTPKARSPFFDSSEPFFVGHNTDEDSIRSADQCTYDDVARHMDWTSRSTSPFISTSFSFVWAIWEAVRRHRAGVKHDIEIAIIDARAVSGRAVTALELLRKGSPQERHKDYWKWYRFALEAQDVLVHGSIPGTAVFASIPIFTLISKLPSYFLQSTTLDDCKASSETPFKNLAWDYTERKPSYKQFCQDMSTRFLRMSPELRLRDTTAGSVRLAITFLRPWFHKAVQADLTDGNSKLRDLSFVIAQWPGQWWVRDHAEIWELTELMVQTIGEEVREKQKTDVSAEIKSLQSFIDDLEDLVGRYEAQLAYKNKESSRMSWTPKTLFPTHIPRRISHRRSDSESTLVDVSLAPVKLVKEAVDEGSDAVPARSPRPHSMIETVSCVCTGLLFGAFITMCIMSSQRRTLLTNLT